MKKLCVLLCIGALISNAQAQKSVSAYGTAINLLSDTPKLAFGFGGKFAYSENEHWALFGGFTKYIEALEELTTVATRKDEFGNTIGETKDYRLRSSMHQFYLGAKLYYHGYYDQDFGFYISTQLSYLALEQNVEIKNYDPKTYDYGLDVTPEQIGSLNIGVGTGVEKKIGPIWVFAELTYQLPFKKKKETKNVIQDLPASIMANAGIKYQIGY